MAGLEVAKGTYVEEGMTTHISIPKKEYEKMKEDLYWLQCLESAGVDNWDGLHYAGELFEEKYPEGEEN